MKENFDFSKPIVWLVQDNGRYNFAAAQPFGQIAPLLPARMQIQHSADEAVDVMTEKLSSYKQSDCILAVGDPAAIAIACSIAAANNNGFFSILKFDRQTNTYYKVEVDLGNMGWLPDQSYN